MIATELFLQKLREEFLPEFSSRAMATGRVKTIDAVKSDVQPGIDIILTMYNDERVVFYVCPFQQKWFRVYEL